LYKYYLSLFSTIMENPDKIHSGSVLITGGSGMVGRYLTSLLLERGYKVSHLSRDENQFGRVRVFRWEPEKGILDPEFLRGVDYLVHLAGSNPGEKRWTKKRRREILDSRVNSAKLIFQTLQENGIKLKAFISASATGIYGAVTSDRIFKEKDPHSTGFLASVCRQWEEAADLFSTSGVRTVKLRAALVLQKTDSGLSKFIVPAKYGLVLRIGSGKQYMPWIHISDLCNIYVRAIEDESFSGVYNAVAPQHVTHNEFMRTLAKVMRRPVILPPVPGFIVKGIMGEMADVVLKGSRISSDRIKKAGYRFTFDTLHYALNDIINNPAG